MPSSAITATRDIRKTDPPARSRGNPLLRYLRPAKEPHPANDNRQPDFAADAPEPKTPTE